MSMCLSSSLLVEDRCCSDIGTGRGILMLKIQVYAYIQVYGNFNVENPSIGPKNLGPGQPSNSSQARCAKDVDVPCASRVLGIELVRHSSLPVGVFDKIKA